MDNRLVFIVAHLSCLNDVLLIVSLVDCVADVTLVVTPLFMFWKVKFPKPSDRTLILVLFTANLLTVFMAGLLCAVWFSPARIGPDSGLLYKMSGELHVKCHEISIRL